jgi:putative nucleotidyltransferase with HDIG domain
MPLTKPTRQFVWWTVEVLLLLGIVAASVWPSSRGEWHPLGLVALLLAIAFAGEWFSVETSAGQLSASLGAMVLAMGLLGPAPAAACGVAAMIQRSTAKRLSPALWLNNLVTYAVAPFVGGLVVWAAFGNVAGMHSQDASHAILFGLTVLIAAAVLLVLNFVLFAVNLGVSEGRSIDRLTRELFLPLLPGELAVGVIATILVLAYRSAGIPILLAAIPVFLIFRHLTVALLRSEDRAEQLAARSRQLVGLQLGVLRTLVRTLGKRDETTGRHAAAVAGYAKALAAELGCDEEERDDVHAAGLLHEIGKFTWPDRVLHAETVDERDMEIVKSHPQEGAALVGALDGYGAVADAILYHHERVDGRGYPAGLIGQEIPVASRILAICSIYATVTGRGGYRAHMTPEEAKAELRRGAENGQLDGEFVEAFVRVLDREGPTFAQDSNFETELEFERRVAELASPRSDAKAPSASRAQGHGRSPRIWGSLRERVLNKD